MITADVQVKLLRVLQEKQIDRLGGSRSIDLDLRVIAATNRDLDLAVADGTFREDLYYRLNVFAIRVPPLRERAEDIPTLVWAFVDEFSKTMGKRVESISKEHMAALQRYPWPGNIRELRNVIERAVIVSTGPRLDAFARMHAGSSAGEYVRLTVTDTGQGMSADVQAQIFTPFFTTKGPGAGTGLGLATVYRIVQQAGGFITVDSTPGHGASFGIYLPVVNEPLDQEVEIAALAPRPRASGTILLAEDDERIRTLDARALSRRGYTVLPARDAVEAQRIAASHGGRIDLLLTDVVMPGLNGYELAEELRRTQPGLKVLYTSGYTEDSETLQELQKAGVAFIQKPYAPLALAQKVREVLED